MPIVRLLPATDSDRPVASRVAIYGPTGKFKTTSIIKTWPRTYKDHEKIAILSYPGEKGWGTIPRDDPEIVASVWEIDDIEKVNPHAVIKEVEKFTADAAASNVATFAGDGAHKLYPWYFRRALLDKIANAPKGWDGDEDKLFGPTYGQAHNDYGLYMTKLLSSTIPYVVVTFWDSLERLDPENTSRSAPKGQYPDLPGVMARNVGGEFSATLYAEATEPDMRGRSRGFWVTRPEGRIRAACIKVPPGIGEKIPVRIPQHFDVLQMYMSGNSVGATELAKKLLGSESILAPLASKP